MATRKRTPPTPEQKAKYRERDRLKHLEWRHAHPEQARASRAAYYVAHRNELRAAARKWRLDPSRLEEVKARDRAKSLAWYHRNPEVARERARNERNRNHLNALIRGAKARARKLGVSYDGLLELKNTRPAVCACCGIEFDYSRKNRRRTLTLDRVDNKGGYVSANVRVICWECNWLKSEMSIERLRQILAYMES